ncbi:hypothetical protein [Haloarchaeobius sp. TZWWS8]|uniref:hypothetical protein n=1 Tax=Haloarchaeobius sp. TZWWS8 TaxID=3446121 RepID=UPI003EB998FC
MSDVSAVPEPPQGQRRLWVIALVFVMLASSVLGVAGAYVYGGQDPLDPPETEFAFAETNAGELTISHDGGEALPAGSVSIVVGDSRTTWAATDFSVDDGDSIATGDSTTISGVESGDTVQLVAERNGRTYVVGEYEVA